MIGIVSCLTGGITSIIVKLSNQWSAPAVVAGPGEQVQSLWIAIVICGKESDVSSSL